MIPLSTVPAVKSYLVNVFSDRSELLDPVQVLYGAPSTYTDLDMVIVGNAQGTFQVSRMVGSGGAGWLSEQYQVSVEILCFRGDDDPQSIEERAYRLGAACIDAVRLDPSLGGLCIDCFPTSFEVDSSWDEEHLGRFVTYTLAFFVDASI